MEKIKSFTINHDTHAVGIYLSSTMGDIFTYDLRFKYPNQEDYLSNASIHTIEHLFATIARNSSLRDQVIYFGPMGCRTGFYLLMRNCGLDVVRQWTIDCMKLCLTLDTIPGSEKIECGNYLEHSLEDAREDIAKYINNLEAIKDNN